MNTSIKKPNTSNSNLSNDNEKVEYCHYAKYLPPQGMSRAKDILPFLPFSRTTLHEWSSDGRFPASVKLSPTMVAWRNADVLSWLESLGHSTKHKVQDVVENYLNQDKPLQQLENDLLNGDIGGEGE